MCYFNFSATSSLTTWGFAFPPVAFKTCPIKNPNSFVLPALNFSTLSGFLEMISSMIGKIMIGSLIWTKPLSSTIFEGFTPV